ncbi:MAG TPA: response regulator [Candidatus Sulfotelmatobacter sp.]|nr:response regulator [Candidatus Sulfotelmatobacter sp.]
MIEPDHKKNRRILIIDDNRAIHDDFRKILSPGTVAAAALDVTEAQIFGQPANTVRKIQYEIDSAYQGQEGVMLVKQALDAGRPYAMAFVDIRMPPGMDGVETTRKIWEVDPEVQIVICTAYADYSWDEMFEKIGNHDGLVILKKPFDTVEALQLAHALTEKWWLLQQSKKKMEELEGMVAARTGELRQANQALQTEIHEHKRTEESLRLLGSAVEQAKESIMITGAELDLPGPAVVFVNPAFTKMTGYSEAEIIGKTPRILQGPRTDRAVLDRLRVNLEQGRVFDGETINYRKDGTEFNLEWQIAPLRNVSGKITHFVAIQHDVTLRKQLEAKLFLSQKMETVGKLAGGIAHEFNSILTAIIGQSELLLEDLPAGSPLTTNAIEITNAANRAASLTRQLLAYGRKQILRPELLDLNTVLAGLEGTLRHLMGRAAVVCLVPAIGLRLVKADAGQLEQVILNMVINAGDAMPNGGKLIMETANLAFDDQSVGRYPELKPGGYVMLAITDTGTGMSDAVKARVFEPFFTTKDVGQGTGLGLSTCYGIIKQSGGHISVYSEPGRGTTFKIYLPQFESDAQPLVRPLDSPDLPRGTETILLAEDDPALREMAAILLRRLGYTVLTATNGVEALSLKHQRDIGHIDLLFTDVVMPHMSGKELADRVQALYPRTRILFTSAYTENAIVHQGVLAPGVALLQKPFTPSALANKIREVLDQPDAPKPTGA